MIPPGYYKVMVEYHLLCFITLFLASEFPKTQITFSQSREGKYSGRFHRITNLIHWFLH